VNPYLIIGALFGAAVLFGGGYYEGHSREAAAFDTFKAQQAAIASQQVVTNHTAVAAISASEAAGLKQIAATATESRNEIQKRNDALVGNAAALATTVASLQRRLTGTSQQLAAVSKTGSSPGVPDGTGDGPLSVGLADLVKFNSAQFLAADDDTVTITGLQAVVAQDRLICNGALPGLSD
jgi:hypothetical protein